MSRAKDGVEANATDALPAENSTEPAVPIVVPSQPVRRTSSLARRISSRTTDLLAIAIVLVGSLTLGRQVLEWWRLDPPAVLNSRPMAGFETEWGRDDQPVELAFSDSPIRLIRQTVTGAGQGDALGRVQEACQKALLVARLPETAADPAELDLLRTVAEQQPEVEQPGEWQIHRLGGNLPMLVGVRFFSGSAAKSDQPHPTTVRRVICWGLVFPARPSGAWTAYTFIKGNSQTSSSSRLALRDRRTDDDLVEVPLPLGCQRTVFVSQSAWNSLTGFQGIGDATGWQNHFSRWSADQGWATAEDWHPIPSLKEGLSWSASFISDAGNPQNSNRVLIQFQLDESGHGSGLIHALPGQVKNPQP
jgi:hypothetical protein